MKNKKIQDLILFEIKKRNMTFEEVISILKKINFDKNNLIEVISLEKFDLLFNILLKEMSINGIENYKKKYYADDGDITQIIDKELEEICFFVSQEKEKDVIDIYYDFLRSNTYSKIIDFKPKYYQKYIGEIINDYLIELEKANKTKMII